MKLLALLGLIPIIFTFFAAFRGVLVFFGDYHDEWWAFPTYMVVELLLAFSAIALVVLIIAFVVS